jgi:hypothetical protein
MPLQVPQVPREPLFDTPQPLLSRPRDGPPHMLRLPHGGAPSWLGPAAITINPFALASA